MRAKAGVLNVGVASIMPTTVVDSKTGEIIPVEEAMLQVESLINFIQNLTQKVFDENYDRLMDDVSTYRAFLHAYARKAGYLEFFPELPKDILVKSRIKELYLHKLMYESSAHYQLKKTNPKKQGKHRMGHTINLGAVNDAMAYYEPRTAGSREINLRFKCWTRDMTFSFLLPPYLEKRNFTKITLPIIGNKGFSFTIKEIPEPSKGKFIAGVDLGKVRPFTMSVIDNYEKPIVSTENSPELSRLMKKRDMLLQEKKSIWKKIQTYDKLGLDTASLKGNYHSVQRKQTRLAKEIAHKVGREVVDSAIQHDVGTIRLEDLRWVQGKKYGGRWNHGAQNESILRKANRAGIEVKRVNAKNTSRVCHECEAKLTHRGRNVWCLECDTVFDRDLNASLNIAKNLNNK